MLLGSPCLSCGGPGDGLCNRCADRLEPAEAFAPPAGLATCTALLAYDGVTRALIVGLKYRHARRFIDRAATGLAEGLRQADTVESLARITWAPTSAARRRVRGYDQAELLARALARNLGVPAVATLRRQPGPPQTGRDRRARASGPTFTALATAARGSAGAPADATHPGTAILLVDDVATTGATLAAAGQILTHCGYDTIHGAVLAHTPARRPLVTTDGGRNLGIPPQVTAPPDRNTN